MALGRLDDVAAAPGGCGDRGRERDGRGSRTVACILRTLVKTSLTLTSMRLRARGDAESGAGTTRGARHEQRGRAEQTYDLKRSIYLVGAGETCALISYLFACEIKVSQ